MAVNPEACLLHLLVLRATICQFSLCLDAFASLQDDRAALRHPIFQVSQLCCTAVLDQSLLLPYGAQLLR